MPANRSRTERWKDNLHLIMERGGGLELSVSHDGADETSPDLVWRVRLLAIGERELLVESPAAAGRLMAINEGVSLVGVMSIGQNRWMFRTRTVTRADGPSPFRGPGLRILLPDGVERVTRREFLRVSTAQLRLPDVECWPLLEPSSVVSAETANRAQILELARTGKVSQGEASDFALPVVGPKFGAKLMNIGGGGVGLVVDKADVPSLERARLIWMRVDMRPTIPAPIGMTAKIAHTHIDSTQNAYAGVGFEFAFNPAHREFVTEQVHAFLARTQLQKRVA